MFAAGLLLGFSTFAHQDASTGETEIAFHQVRTVLRKLAELSLQAGHYYEILTSLSDAIVLDQKRLADRQKQMTSQYLDQIFTANIKTGLGGANLNNDLHKVGEPISTGGIANSSQTSNTNGVVLDSLTTGSYGLMISEGFPWPADDFFFDWQSYEHYFDDAVL